MDKKRLKVLVWAIVIFVLLFNILLGLFLLNR